MPSVVFGHRSRAVLLLLSLPMLLILAACGASSEPQPEITGEAAPAFTLPAASGGEVSLSDYAGEPVLLYFHMAVG